MKKVLLFFVAYGLSTHNLWAMNSTTDANVQDTKQLQRCFHCNIQSKEPLCQSVLCSRAHVFHKSCFDKVFGKSTIAIAATQICLKCDTEKAFEECGGGEKIWHGAMPDLNSLTKEENKE